MSDPIRRVVDGLNRTGRRLDGEAIKEMMWKCDYDGGIYRGETAYLNHVATCRDSHMIPLGYVSESDRTRKNFSDIPAGETGE